jgi:transposase-like protein
VFRSIFSAPHFNDEAAAYAYVESKLWADGRVCPHCGVIDKSGALRGKTDRIGLYKCYACRKKFTVKIGTIFEDSHIQMRDWLTAIHLICSSKKGISANQLHRTLGITLKSAWFMGHRIREAMRDDKLGPLGGLETHVESDETFIGRLQGQPKRKAGAGHKNTVLTLVERGGKARSFHIASTTRSDVEQVVLDNVKREATLMTDEAPHYKAVGREFLDHQSVNHRQDEYVRGIVHTNTVEGFYSIFKRGMKGIYQHCSEKHLHRYLAEYDFRYSNRVALGVNDEARSGKALSGFVGKRLTYRRSNEASHV